MSVKKSVFKTGDSMLHFRKLDSENLKLKITGKNEKDWISVSNRFWKSDEDIDRLANQVELPAKEIKKIGCEIEDNGGISEYYSTSLQKITADLVSCKVVIHTQIVGEQAHKVLSPKSIEINCINCSKKFKIDISEKIDLLKDIIFKGSKLEKLLPQALKSIHPPCVDGKDHIFSTDNTEESGYIDYSLLYVIDVLKPTERFDERIAKPRLIHLVNKTIPRAKKVVIYGWVVVNPKTRDICIIANNIEPEETEITNFSLTDEDKKNFSKYFVDEKYALADQINPNIVGEKRKVAKEAVVDVLHSPLTIPDVNGKHIRGGLRVVFIGDTGEAKSSIARYLVGGEPADPSPYVFGNLVIGETSKRTGILYTIDVDKKIIIWGALPLSDTGLVIIDGMQQLHNEDIGQMRESLSSQIIKVDKYVKGQALARTRIIATMNPNKIMGMYTYPVQAISDNRIFFKTPDVRRWDLFITFNKEDVDGKEVIYRKTGEPQISSQVFEQHVNWAWSRKVEQIQYAEESKEKIREFSLKIVEKYEVGDIPVVVGKQISDILCRFSVARACRAHSTDMTHENVIVKEEHVVSAYKFLTGVYDSLS